MDTLREKFPGTAALLVLGVLEGGDRCGFQIIHELEMRSDKTFSLAEGSLYPVLHGLERLGEITSYDGENESARPRRYYRLTRQGIRALRKKRRAWKLYLAKTGAVLGGEACDNE